MHKTRILFVCMQMSPHSSRWIASLDRNKYDIHVLPCNFSPPHQLMPSHVTLYTPFLSRHSFTSILRKLGLLLNSRNIVTAGSPSHIFPLYIPYAFQYILSRLLQCLFRRSHHNLLFGSLALLFLVRRLKPDIVHSMEFQHNAYRVLPARHLCGASFPLWLATNWGSDIYYYQNEKHHLEQIKRVLRLADFYSCECRRDVSLARSLGYRGPSLPVIPNSGGFDLQTALTLREKQHVKYRKTIVVKGYEHFAGRAVTALHALSQCNDILSGYRIAIFSSSHETTITAKDLYRKGRLPRVDIFTSLSHSDLLKLHASSRIYIGISQSDAISTSALEAMAMGAFPIQSDTSCCDEWFTHGVGGFHVPYDDVNTIADYIRIALLDDQLVSQAFSKNWVTVKNRLDNAFISSVIDSIYSTIMLGSRSR